MQNLAKFTIFCSSWSCSWDHNSDRSLSIKGSHCSWKANPNRLEILWRNRYSLFSSETATEFRFRICITNMRILQISSQNNILRVPCPKFILEISFLDGHAWVVLGSNFVAPLRYAALRSIVQCLDWQQGSYDFQQDSRCLVRAHFTNYLLIRVLYNKILLQKLIVHEKNF